MMIEHIIILFAKRQGSFYPGLCTICNAKIHLLATYLAGWG